MDDDLKKTVEAPIVTNQFKKGVSGNPRGRPKGSKNKTTLIRKEMEISALEELQKDSVKVLQKAVELALEGDTSMIKLVSDKILPNAKVDTEKGGQKGFGGINITIAGLEEKPAINAEIIEEIDDEDE